MKKIDMKIKALLVAVLVPLGAALSRWHGGGFIGGSPKILKAFLWAAPFMGATVGVYVSHETALWKTAVAAVVCLALCMVGKNTGHGGGMDLAHNPKEPGGDPARSPEKLEYLILWLHGKIPQYWYDALILVLVGLAAVSGAALTIGVLHPLAGLVIALGGVLKAAAYMVGWLIYPQGKGDGPKDLDEATAIGEFLTGAFAYAALSLAVFIVF